MPARRSSARHVTHSPGFDEDTRVNVFQGVVIPNKRMSASTTASVPSRDASTRGVSTEYDTPTTSAFATPDESSSRVQISYAVRKLRPRGPPRDASAHGVSSDYSTTDTSAVATPEESNSQALVAGRLAHSAKDFKLGGSSISSSTKRKREEENRSHNNISGIISRRLVEAFNFEDSDEALALQLQEAEYDAQPSSSKALSGPKKVVGKGKTVVTEDTEDSALSDMSLVDSDFVSDDDEPLRKATRLSRPSPFAEPVDEDDDESVSSDPWALQIVPRSRRRYQQHQRGRTMEEEVNFRKVNRRTKLEKAHPEINTMWKDLEKVPQIVPVAAQQPTTITRNLKSFQLEGLDWMIRQEKSQFKGGLLGDEMGMGKTIQAVSLIMSDFPVPGGAPTLVLLPPVALMQWQNEINSYTDGKLKVLVVHNSNPKSKNLTVKMIKSYHVILMSYNSLESMFRKQEKGWTRGEDIIKEDSPIHAVKFHRLILDEAHSIKQRTTGVAKACFALKGTYKWCLSGTPVQNRVGEFFSLLRFLEVRPFAEYFCEACPCAELHWAVNDEYRCEKCKHSASEHRSVFNEEILNPIVGHDMEQRSDALDKLHSITARIMLRRMKKDYTASMELPPKMVKVHNEFFGKIERDFSSSIMQNTNREFDTYVSRGVVLNNYANIFGLIMQMRQVANHPDLILKKHAEGGQNILVCNVCDEAAEDAIRSACKHDFCRSCVKTLMRSYDRNDDTSVDCPRCHVPLAIDLDQPEIEQDEDLVKKSSIINRIRMSSWTSSTKIEMLVYELYKLRSSKATLKSIVFSQFTSMLQLVEWRLRRAGFNTVLLDGSMTPVQRQRSIDYFMKNTHVEVFLVSLKAGGVALNLTEASRVFIIDPWWNPAAEWQSADRCHRIGQARPCVITRLVIEDSVESRMVQLQEKKSNMIASTVNQDKVAMEKLSPDDLQFLFRGT